MTSELVDYDLLIPNNVGLAADPKLRRALEQSINVPAVKLWDLVGGRRVIDFSQRCGIRTRLPNYPSISLGAADLIPMELAAAFATVANQGVYIEPALIERIAGSDSQVLY